MAASIQTVVSLQNMEVKETYDSQKDFWEKEKHMEILRVPSGKLVKCTAPQALDWEDQKNRKHLWGIYPFVYLWADKICLL